MFTSYNQDKDTKDLFPLPLTYYLSEQFSKYKLEAVEGLRTRRAGRAVLMKG